MTVDEVTRLTKLLRSAIKLSNISNREIERQLGMSAGTLSRLFSGGIELKVKHILDICDTIHFPPAKFFQAAYPHVTHSIGTNGVNGDGADGEALRQALEHLYPAEPLGESGAPVPLVPGIGTGDFERMIMASLRKLLSGLGSATD